MGALYREAIIDALSKAVEILTLHSEHSFDEVITKGLAPISDATGFNRIAVYRLLDKDAGRIGQIYLWANGEKLPLDKELVELPKIPPIIKWLKTLMKGEYIHCNVTKMEEDEADFCELFGVKSVLFVPIFTHGEFWGIVTLEDRTNYRYFDEDCLDLLCSAARLCANAFIRNEMTNNASNAISALEKREKLTKALNDAAIKFISREDDSFERAMSSGVQIIADILDIDRMSIWHNSQTKDGLFVSQIYRWDRKEGGTTLPLAEYQNIAHSKLIPGWSNILTEDKVINGPVQLLAETKTLRSLNITSVFVAPVCINNTFWGGVIFEDHEKERYFDDESAAMMRSAALLCVNTVLREEMQNEITKAFGNIKEKSELLLVRLKQQELISEISKGFISSGDSQKYIYGAIERLGHYHKASKVVIFSVNFDSCTASPAYYWNVNGDPIKLCSVDLFELTKTTFPERLPECSTLPIIFCDNVALSGNNAYLPLLEIDTCAFIIAPLYVEGYLWGVLTLEQCHRPRHWTDNEKTFVAMTTGTIAGILMRGIYNSMLKDAYEKATVASKAKGEFLSNMSHEMRTPLNAIIGMTAIAKNAVDLERKNYALNKIESASTHLLGVINDVLDMSKIEANKLELSAIEFNLEKLLQKTITVINFRAEEKHQKLTVRIDKAIPEYIIGDDQRISQVVTNLLSNAVKFTHNEGAVHLDACVLKKEDDIYTIQISISDTGIGISKEQQVKLFQPFQQAEASTVRKYGGTGLGLSICRNIVKMMGGEISVRSELNKGSVFTFTIQAKKGHKKELSLAERTLHWKDIRILAVDDDKDILEIFKDIAYKYNVYCDTAISGDDALRLVEINGSYNIYFIDWKMPGIDGITLTGALKTMERKEKNSIVIMISAAEWTEIEENARKAGVERFLSKPLFPSAIADTICECLGMERYCNAQEQSNIKDFFTGSRILLAEDVNINREIVIALLEPLGLEIECAENGIQAVEIFRAAPDRYQIIFMDVQMPEMDGYDATRAIRKFEKEQNRKPTPILAMTANVFKEDIEKCLNAGMNDHISKPLDLEIVVEKLQKYLQQN